MAVIGYYLGFKHARRHCWKEGVFGGKIHYLPLHARRFVLFHPTYLPATDYLHLYAFNTIIPCLALPSPCSFSR